METATTEAAEVSVAPQEVSVTEISQAVVSDLVIKGDLSKLTAEQKIEYYNWLCKSLGLNPASKPFAVIRTKEGKEVMYALKDATEQLRKIYGVSVVEMTQSFQPDLCITKCRVKDSKGRYDVATGVTPFRQSLSAEEKANAIMKSETKAKRRATLSICGLGMLDESELDTMGNYESVPLAPPQGMLSSPLVKDVVVAKGDIADCLTLEELKALWEKLPPSLQRHESILEAKEAAKAYLLTNTLTAEMNQLYEASTLEELQSIYEDIKALPEYPKWALAYQGELERIVRIKTKRLNNDRQESTPSPGGGAAQLPTAVSDNTGL